MNYYDLLQSPILPPHIVTLTQKAAHNKAPVLIQGEQGTGKELIAKIIHYTGDWKSYPFYKMNCRAFTEDAFRQQLSGLIKELNNGTIPATLYLEEIGGLEKSNQLKLLELVEDGLFQNGFEKKAPQHLRFISSSSENLKEKVPLGKFSEDLYYRLNTLPIVIPPLRDRLHEISTIAEYILTKHSEKIRIRKLKISDSALDLLKSYWWPGNLKELEHVMIRSAANAEGQILTEKDLFFETENSKNPFIAFLKKSELNAPVFRKGGQQEGQNGHSLSHFMIGLVHRIKNPLVSVKTFTQLLREKFDDAEFRDYFYNIVTEDIEEIDTVLNGLLNYIRINTPIKKTNTVHFILEEILKRYELQLEGRKIRVFKKFEKNLPETTVHDEQLRYILNSLLQYAIPAILPHGSIGFLTKSLPVQEKKAETQTDVDRGEKSIEIIIVFTGYKKAVEKETVLGIPSVEKKRPVELELQLIEEIIKINRGKMAFEVSEKKQRTLISLRIPVERRRVIYYPSAKIGYER